MKKKLLALILSVAVVASIAAAGTLAYLTAQTDDVVNTFTVGDIDLTLTETTGTEYKILPGATVEKDPTVTVLADSENCWVYVLVVNELNDTVEGASTLNITDSWELVESVPGMGVQWDDTIAIYRLKTAVGTASTDQIFPVFTQVSISGALTNEQNASLEGKTIQLAAYAHQVDNVDRDTADKAAVEALLNTLVG